MEGDSFKEKVYSYERFMEILTYFLIKMENVLEPEDYKPLKRNVTLEEIKEKLVKLETSIMNNFKNNFKNERLVKMEEENYRLKEDVRELVERQKKVMAMTLSSKEESQLSSLKQQGYDEMVERLNKVESELRLKSTEKSAKKKTAKPKKTGHR